MELSFGFGLGIQSVYVPDKNLMSVLTPKDMGVEQTEQELIQAALLSPIGSDRLSNAVKPGEKIAIVTSDITRPLPSYKIIPYLLSELYLAGVQAKDITVVFALGSHRQHTPGEMRKLVGSDVYEKIRCIDSTPDDCIHLGSTQRGTPVDVCRAVAEANKRICLGNIEYHYFAGYSGGGKAIMPGVSTRPAIQSNHRFMVDADSIAGKLEGNPVREDIEEAATLCGVDFILNVVLDAHKRIVYAVAGDMIKAHRVGCAFLDRYYKLPLKEKADIVIVSQGGAPKDLNLYQTQKALDNAKHAVKDGGIIILIGSCKEGFGEKVFENWMTASPEPHSMIERITTDFKLGGHKAAAIAMVLEKASIFLVSELNRDLVKSIYLEPFDSAQKALDEAFLRLGNNATVLAMPYGGSILPYLCTKD